MTTKNVLLNISWIAFAFAAPLLARADAADETSPNAGLEEITVTAERHEKDLQKTALTVSVLEGDEIERTGKTTFETVLQNVPGVQLQFPAGSEPPTPTIAIRGLGTDGNNKPPSTAVYMDGVLLDNEGAQFYDIARVEVLRGPQGTLYGGTATGGAVNIITNDPKFSGFDGNAQLDVGDYGLLHTTGVVNVPLNDEFAARFGFNNLRRDSYADPSSSSHDETNARAKVLFKPSDTFSVLFGFELYRFSGVVTDGRQAQNLNGNFVGPYVPEAGFGTIAVNKYDATVLWDLGFGALTSISAFQHLRDNLQQANILVGNQDIVHPRKDLITQEIRLASEPDSKVSWVTGAYFQDSNEASTFRLGTGGPGLPTLTTVPIDAWGLFYNDFVLKSYGLFGQATYPISSAVRLTGGLRGSLDQVSMPQSTEFLAVPNSPCPPAACPPGIINYSDFEKDYHSLDGLVRLEGDVTSTSLLYASASTGYRPGGVGQNGSSYNVERVRSYEVGSKNRFLDSKVQLNGAVYLNDYPAFQNSATIYLPGNLQLGSVVAVPARFYGLELEAVALLTSDDRFTFSPSWERAGYTGDGVISVAGGATGVIMTDGKDVPHAPRWNISGAYDHTFRLSGGGSLVASADAHYQSSQAVVFDSCLFNPSSCVAEGNSIAEVTQAAYTLADASMTYNPGSDKYSLTAYVRNLTNLTFKTGYDSQTAVLGPPRTFGVIVSTKF